MKNFILSASMILCGLSSANLSAQSTKDKFTSEDKKFNDWSVSVFAGTNALQNSDLTSWGRDEGESWFTPGYDFHIMVNRQITHAFGISLEYQMGGTKQQAVVYDDAIKYYGMSHGKTNYHAISLLGDINLSNLLRRTDNRTELKWALHGYLGGGLIGYKAKRTNYPSGSVTDYNTVSDIKLNDKSFFFQGGLGLRYKINEKFDAELKGMYVMTGDDEFDGSGLPNPRNGYTPADMNPNRSENMITLSLGLHYKFGKHKEALQWAPFIVPAVTVKEDTPFVCVDEDNDGVCDQWDKCPGTPAGYKVDGSGCPLDSDGDGVVDTEDECPTIPGPPTNKGCPEAETVVSAGQIATLLTDAIQGIEFDYDSDKIRSVSYSKLDNAAEVIVKHANYSFWVEGHTDAAGSDAYNQKLSERRAASVVRYLVNKGVNANQLFPIGKGESDLKYPECNPTTNCPAWKNLENRRVVFKEKN